MLRIDFFGHRKRSRYSVENCRAADCDHRTSGSLVQVQQGEPKNKALLRKCFIFIQSEGLVCNLTAGEYVIAEGVWHHASACILLRIDYIQHFVLIPYRRQAADFIHAYRRDYIESYVEVLDFGGLFVFLEVKNTLLSPLHLFSDLMDLNLRLQPQVEKIKPLIYCIKNNMCYNVTNERS